MKKVIIAIILACTLFVLIVPAALGAPGPNPDNYYKYRGHYYQVFYPSGGVNWDTAVSQSASKTYTDRKGIVYQGHLVTINSKQEQGFVYRKFVKNGTQIWIGLHQVSGAWTTWVTGEPVDYTNWAPNKPDKGTGDYAAQMTSGYSGGWYDLDSTTGLYYVVEYEPTT